MVVDEQRGDPESRLPSYVDERFGASGPIGGVLEADAGRYALISLCTLRNQRALLLIPHTIVGQRAGDESPA